MPNDLYGPNGEAHDRIGFFFALGHGHYAQFLNFQECAPDAEAQRLEWVGLSGMSSPDLLSGRTWVPGGLRWRRNLHWHFREGYRRERRWQGLFVAGAQASFLPYLRRQPSYLYTDLSDSLKQELAPWYDHQLRGNALMRAARHAAKQRLYGAAAGVITMSDWAAAGIRRDHGLPKARVHTILPGANLRRWQFVDRSKRASNQTVRILMVGGQFALKGGPLMLDWAAQTNLRNWEMDIVTWPGELPPWVIEALGHPGSETKVSGTLAPRLPNVRVHCGMKANTPELMCLFQQADIFCLPTHADGSSIASLEAMATGLPVVVGAVGGIPELLQDGQTGFLLRDWTVSSISQRLEPLITDSALRIEVGRAAREACEDCLNVSRQMRQILALIDSDTSQRN